MVASNPIWWPATALVSSMPWLRPVYSISRQPSWRCSGGDIRVAMIDQVTSPVQWVSCIRALQDAGMTEAVEVGESKVLSTIGRNGDGKIPHISVAEPRTMQRLFVPAAPRTQVVNDAV